MSKGITILQCGGGWADSIGNAFIDFGSLYALKKAAPKSTATLSSNFPKSYLARGLSNPIRILDGAIFDRLNNLLDLRNVSRPDYIVLSGEVLSETWIKLCAFPKLFEKNSKVIIHGGGGSKYTPKEFDFVRSFLKKINLYAFISRDERTFKEYDGIAEHSFSGIDCAFFCRYYFSPIPLNLPEYITLTFDKIKEPSMAHEKRMIIRTHHAYWSQCGLLKKFFYFKRQKFDKKNTLISDVPEDYLNIYSQSQEVHSDRIHACIPALAFGRKAKLYINTPRIALFERIGAGQIKSTLTNISPKVLEKEAEKQIKFLAEILV